MTGSMVGIVAGAVAALVVALVAVVRGRWRRGTKRAVARLVGLARSGGGRPGEHTRTELRGLPAPVVRYFEFALAPRQPRIAVARMRQVGMFAARPGAWAPFEATEVFATDPPGFVWDARIRTPPLLSVRVRDALIDSAGSMRATVAGAVPVVDRRDTPALARASLLRYLAEAVWLPTALLPASGVAWSPISDRRARASIVCNGVRATMDVDFGDKGEIVRIVAERDRDVDGKPVPTRWEGRYYDYVVRDGMRVPSRGEVGWHLPEGWYPYWWATIEDLRYEYRPVPPQRDGSGDEGDHGAVGQADRLADDVRPVAGEPVPLVVGAPGQVD